MILSSTREVRIVNLAAARLPTPCACPPLRQANVARRNRSTGLLVRSAGSSDAVPPYPNGLPGSSPLSIGSIAARRQADHSPFTFGTNGTGRAPSKTQHLGCRHEPAGRLRLRDRVGHEFELPLGNVSESQLRRPQWRLVLWAELVHVGTDHVHAPDRPEELLGPVRVGAAYARRVTGGSD